jgi:hypothetical protein
MTSQVRTGYSKMHYFFGQRICFKGEINHSGSNFAGLIYFNVMRWGDK